MEAENFQNLNQDNLSHLPYSDPLFSFPPPLGLIAKNSRKGDVRLQIFEPEGSEICTAGRVSISFGQSSQNLLLKMQQNQLLIFSNFSGSPEGLESGRSHQ